MADDARSDAILRKISQLEGQLSKSGDTFERDEVLRAGEALQVELAHCDEGLQTVTQDFGREIHQATEIIAILQGPAGSGIEVSELKSMLESFVKYARFLVEARQLLLEQQKKTKVDDDIDQQINALRQRHGLETRPGAPEPAAAEEEDEEGEEGTGIDDEVLFAGSPMAAALMRDVAETIHGTGKGTLADLRKIPGVTDANVKELATYLAGKGWLLLRGGRVSGVNVSKLGQDLGLKPAAKSAGEAEPQGESREGEPRFGYGDTVYVREREGVNKYRRLISLGVVELRNGFSDVIITDGDYVRGESAENRRLSKHVPLADAEVETEFPSGKLQPVELQGRRVARGDVYRFVDGPLAGKQVQVHRVDRGKGNIIGLELSEGGEPRSRRIVIRQKDKVEYVETVDASQADTLLVQDIRTAREHRATRGLPFTSGEVVYMKPRSAGEPYRRVSVVDIVGLPKDNKSDRRFVVVSDGYETDANFQDSFVKEADLPAGAEVKEGLRDRQPLKLEGVELDKTKVKYIRTLAEASVLAVVDIDERHRCMFVAPLDSDRLPDLGQKRQILERDFYKEGVQVVDQDGRPVDATRSAGAAAGGPGGPEPARPDGEPGADLEFEKLKQRVHVGDRYVVALKADNAVFCYISKIDDTNKEVHFETTFKDASGERAKGQLNATEWSNLETTRAIFHVMPATYDRFIPQFAVGEKAWGVRYKTQGDKLVAENQPLVVEEINLNPGEEKVVFANQVNGKKVEVKKSDWETVLRGGWVLMPESKAIEIRIAIKEGPQAPEDDPNVIDVTPGSGGAPDAAAEAAARAEAEEKRQFERFKREHPLRSAIYIERAGGKEAYSVIGFDDTQRTVRIKGLFGQDEEATLSAEDLVDILTTPGSKVETMMLGDYGAFVRDIKLGDVIFLYEYTGGEPQRFSVTATGGAGDSTVIFGENDTGGAMPPLDKTRWDMFVDQGWVFHHVKAPTPAPDARAAAGTEQEDDTLVFLIEGKRVTKGQSLYVKRPGETGHTEWTVDKFTKKGADEFITLKKVSSDEEIKLRRSGWREAVTKNGILAEKPAAAAGAPDAAAVARAEAAARAEEERLRQAFVDFVQDISQNYVVTFISSTNRRIEYLVESVEGAGEETKLHLKHKTTDARRTIDLNAFTRTLERGEQIEKQAPAAPPPPDPAAEAAARQAAAEVARLAAAEAARQAAEAVRLAKEQREQVARAEFVVFVQDIAVGYTVRITDARGARDLKVDKVEGDGEARRIHLAGQRQPLDVQDFVKRREQNVQFEKTPPTAAAAAPAGAGGAGAAGAAGGGDTGRGRARAGGDPNPAPQTEAERAREEFKQEFLHWVGGGVIPGQRIQETGSGDIFKVQKITGAGETATIHVTPTVGLPTPTEWNLARYTRMREAGQTLAPEHLSEGRKAELKYGASYYTLVGSVNPGDQFTAKLSDANQMIFEVVSVLADPTMGGLMLRVKTKMAGQTAMSPGEHDFDFRQYTRQRDGGYRFERAGAEKKTVTDYPPGKYRIEQASGLQEELTVFAHQDGKLLCEFESGDVTQFSPEDFGFLRPLSIEQEDREREALKQEFIQLVGGLEKNVYVQLVDANGDITKLEVWAKRGTAENTVLDLVNLTRTDNIDVDLATFSRLRKDGARFEKIDETPEQLSVREMLEVVGPDTLKKWYELAAQEMGEHDYEGRADELADHLKEAFADIEHWPDDKRKQLETVLRRKGLTGFDQQTLFDQFKDIWERRCVDILVPTVILMAQHQVEIRMTADHEVKEYEKQKREKAAAAAKGNILTRTARGLWQRKTQYAVTGLAGFLGGVGGGFALGYGAANLINRRFMRSEGLQENKKRKHTYKEAQERVLHEIEGETESAERLAVMISEVMGPLLAGNDVTVADAYGHTLERIKERATDDEAKNTHTLEEFVWKHDVWIEGKRPDMRSQMERLAQHSSGFGKIWDSIRGFVTSDAYVAEEGKLKYLVGEICSTGFAAIAGHTVSAAAEAGGALGRIAARAGLGALTGGAEQGIKFQGQEGARKTAELHRLVANLEHADAAAFAAEVASVESNETALGQKQGRRKFLSMLKAGGVRATWIAAVGSAVEAGKFTVQHAGDIWDWTKNLMGVASGNLDQGRFEGEAAAQREVVPQDEQLGYWTQKDIDEVNASRGAPTGETPATAEARPEDHAGTQAETRPGVKGPQLTEKEQQEFRQDFRLGDFAWGPPHTDGKGFLHMANQLERDPEFKELITERERAAYPNIKSDETALHHFRVRIAEEGGYNWRTGTYDKVPLKGVTYSVGANKGGAVTIQADKGHLRELSRPIHMGRPSIVERPGVFRVSDEPNATGLKHFSIDDGHGGHHDVYAEHVAEVPGRPDMILVTDALGQTVERSIQSLALTLELPAAGQGSAGLDTLVRGNGGIGGGGVDVASASRTTDGARIGGGTGQEATQRVGASKPLDTRPSRTALIRKLLALGERESAPAAEAKEAMVPELKLRTLFAGQVPRLLSDRPGDVFFVQGAFLNNDLIARQFLYDSRGDLVGYLDEAGRPHVGTRMKPVEGLPDHIIITDSARADAARLAVARADAAAAADSGPAAPGPKDITFPDGRHVEFRYGPTDKVVDIIRSGGSDIPRPDVANAFFVDSQHYGSGAVPRPVEGGILNLGSYYQIYERLQETGRASGPEAQYVRDTIHRVMQQIARVDGGKSVDEIYKPSMLREFGFEGGQRGPVNVDDLISQRGGETAPQLHDISQLLNMREHLLSQREFFAPGRLGQGYESIPAEKLEELRQQLLENTRAMKQTLAGALRSGQNPTDVYNTVLSRSALLDLKEQIDAIETPGKVNAANPGSLGHYEETLREAMKELLRNMQDTAARERLGIPQADGASAGPVGGKS